MEKKLMMGMLASLAAVITLHEVQAAPNDFQVPESAPPAIKLMLEAAKARESAGMKTPRHVESRVLRLPDQEDAPISIWSTDYEEQEVTPTPRKLTAFEEEKLAQLEAELAAKKIQHKRAQAQINATEDAFDSLKETLEEGIVSKPSVPPMPFDTLIPEPPKLENSLPMPEVRDLPLITVAMHEQEKTRSVKTTPLKFEATCNAKTSYRLSFSNEQVQLQVNDLTFQIEVIDGAISIQEIR